jgi:hypothetical protein
MNKMTKDRTKKSCFIIPCAFCYTVYHASSIEQDDKRPNKEVNVCMNLCAMIGHNVLTMCFRVCENFNHAYVESYVNFSVGGHLSCGLSHYL